MEGPGASLADRAARLDQVLLQRRFAEGMSAMHLVSPDLVKFPVTDDGLLAGPVAAGANGIVHTPQLEWDDSVVYYFEVGFECVCVCVSVRVTARRAVALLWCR